MLFLSKCPNQTLLSRYLNQWINYKLGKVHRGIHLNSSYNYTNCAIFSHVLSGTYLWSWHVTKLALNMAEHVIGCALSIDGCDIWLEVHRLWTGYEFACAQIVFMTCDLLLYLHWFSTKEDEQIMFDVHDRQAWTCVSWKSMSMPSSNTVKLSELWTFSRRTKQESNIMLFMWSTLESASSTKYAASIKLTWLDFKLKWYKINRTKKWGAGGSASQSLGN